MLAPMGSMARVCLVLVCVLCAAPVRAQVLPPVPELKLHFPVQPVSFSFSGAEIGGYQSGPLRLFRAESLWLRTPGLKLLTFGANERAYELNCRLSCEPIVKLSMGVEARLSMPNLLPSLRDPHAYLRYSSQTDSEGIRRHSAFEAGFAGAF
jgi:hypothetical protein